MATKAYLHPRPVAKRLRRYTRSCLYRLVYSSNGLFYRASLVIRLSSSRIRDRPRPFAGPSRVGCGLTVNVHCRAVPRSWQLRTRPRIAFHEGHPSTRALADLADHRGSVHLATRLARASVAVTIIRNTSVRGIYAGCETQGTWKLGGSSRRNNVFDFVLF